MKATNLPTFKSLALLFIFAFSGIVVTASNEFSKSLQKSAGVPDGTKIIVTNKSGDMDISITKNNKVTIHTQIRVEGNHNEDIKKLVKAIEGFTFEQQGSNFIIDTRFWKKMHTINGKTTIELQNGDKVKIKDFEISHTLEIPASSEFQLKNKYSDVNLESLTEQAYLEMYDGDLVAGNFEASLELNMKYADASLGTCKNITFKLYDSDVKVSSANDIKIESKYSSIQAGIANNIIANSYDDKFKFQKINNAEIVSKYTHMKLGEGLKSLKLDIYDCTLEAADVGKVVFNSKYSELGFSEVGMINSDSSYDDNLVIAELGKMNIGQSKYSTYKIGTLMSSLGATGYDDIFKIEKLKTGFEEVNLKGKYVKLHMNVESSANYSLLVNAKYPKLDLPPGLTISEKVKQKEHLKLKATSGNGDGGKIVIEGYDMVINL